MKPSKTVNTHRYHQQLRLHLLCVKNRLDCQQRYDILNFLHNNAQVNNVPELLGETQLGGATPSCLYTRPTRPVCQVYIPDTVAEQHFDSYEEVRKWRSDEWFTSKEKDFFCVVYKKLPERCEPCTRKVRTSILYIFLLSLRKHSRFKYTW